MDVQTDGQNPCVLQDFVPCWAAALSNLNLFYKLLKQGAGTADPFTAFGLLFYLRSPLSELKQSFLLNQLSHRVNFMFSFFSVHPPPSRLSQPLGSNTSLWSQQEQVAQGQYMVSDTHCPALLGCKSE